MQDLIHSDISAVSRASIVAILVAAGALRVYGIDFGFPELLHNDEIHEMNRALELGMGIYAWDRAGKGVFYLLEATQLGVAFIALKLAGTVTTAHDFAQFFVAHEPAFYLAARIISAVVGLATVFLLFQVGRKRDGVRTGLLAAFILSFCGLHIANSHFATVDVLLTFFAFCSLAFLYSAADVARRRDYVLAGIFAGFALATKLSAAVLLLGFIAAASLNLRRSQGSWTSISTNLLIGLGVLGLTAIAVEPGYVAKFFRVHEILGNILGTDGPANLQSADSPNLWTYYGSRLVTDFGAVVLLVFTCRLIWGVLKGFAVETVSAAIALPYFVLICIVESNLAYDRYLLPLLPLISLVTARGIVFGAVHVQHSLQTPRAATVVLAALVILVISLNIVGPGWSTAVKFGVKHNRTLAMEWIEANVPPNSAILAPGNAEHRATFLVPVMNSKDKLEVLLEDLDDRFPGKAYYLRLQEKNMEANGRPRYPLTLIQHYQAWPRYVDVMSSYDYVIIDDHRFVTGGNRALTSRQSRTEFYEQLQTQGDFSVASRFARSADRFGSSITIFARDVELNSGEGD